MNSPTQNGFDVLDMKNYRMEKIPQKDKSNFEKKLMLIGTPLAILSFILILFVIDMPF
jgi:sodium-dependent dicarboxylate transporter 2/3/5